MAAPRPTLRVSVRASGRWMVVAASGTIDFTTGPTLSQELDSVIGQGERVRLAVDLSAVEFFDSSGLRCLVMAHEKVRRRAGQFVLLQPPVQIFSKVRVSGLSDVLPVVNELPD